MRRTNSAIELADVIDPLEGRDDLLVVGDDDDGGLELLAICR
jgi:hypothetical protein